MRTVHLILSMALLTSLNAQRTVGLTQYESPLGNHVLIAPISSTHTYLVDECGLLLHEWSSAHTPGLSAQLQPDGTLLRLGNLHNPDFTGGGSGGIIERFAWTGELIWSYSISNDSLCLHHDFTVLPNGNILVIAWDRRSGDEAIALGKDPASTNDWLWSERIIELRPFGTNDAEVVWEWKLWDHLMQAFAADLPNHGVAAERTGRVNINFFQGPPASFDWIHLNSVAYNVDLDQVMVSSHNLDEVWVIDHSTTTEEAAGSTGGSRGKGGDLLYRWGNPRAYGRGTQADQQLFGQHHATWLPVGHPDAGKILVFNNGNGRPAGSYSSVEIIDPPVDENGDYDMPISAAFLPVQPQWTWTAPVSTDFYATNIGGVFPVGNGFLITDGPGGRGVFIQATGEEVWSYINPVTANGLLAQGATATSNSVFRFERYAADFAGFDGIDLTPSTELETDPILPGLCLTTGSEVQRSTPMRVFPVPASTMITVEADRAGYRVEINDARGRLAMSDASLHYGPATLDVSHLVNGVYSISVLDLQGITKSTGHFAVMH